MKKIYLLLFLILGNISFAQNDISTPNNSQNRFKFIEVKTHFGAFLKSDDVLTTSGLLDNGYGGVTIKLGWQPTDPDGWASR